MRSTDSAAIDNGYELICEYSKCRRIFYSSTRKAKFCCDTHRYRAFQEKNEKGIAYQKDIGKRFKNNYMVLKKLYEGDFRKVTKRELLLSGFDFQALPAHTKTENDYLAIEYNQFVLCFDSSAEQFLIDKKTS